MARWNFWERQVIKLLDYSTKKSRQEVLARTDIIGFDDNNVNEVMS